MTEWKSNAILGETTTASGDKVYIVDKTVMKNGPPNGITQKQTAKGGIDRNYYDENGDQTRQVSNNDHGHKKESKFGKHGEHTHDYRVNERGKLTHGEPRELDDEERKENNDIL